MRSRRERLQSLTGGTPQVSTANFLQLTAVRWHAAAHCRCAEPSDGGAPLLGRS
jgi:hypothetical protein